MHMFSGQQCCKNEIEKHPYVKPYHVYPSQHQWSSFHKECNYLGASLTSDTNYWSMLCKIVRYQMSYEINHLSDDRQLMKILSAPDSNNWCDDTESYCDYKKSSLFIPHGAC